MGRKPSLSPEQARQQREKLQVQLRELETHDAQRYTVIGRVVAHRAERDETFAKELREMLDVRSPIGGERMSVGLTNRAAAADAAPVPRPHDAELPTDMPSSCR
jgi:hypothetical protein